MVSRLNSTLVLLTIIALLSATALCDGGERMTSVDCELETIVLQTTCIVHAASSTKYPLAACNSPLMVNTPFALSTNTFIDEPSIVNGNLALSDALRNLLASRYQ